MEHSKATFKNRFGITLVGDVYKPKGATGPFAAVALSGPSGAVKEQSSGLYAQSLAETFEIVLQKVGLSKKNWGTSLSNDMHCPVCTGMLPLRPASAVVASEPGKQNTVR